MRHLHLTKFKRTITSLVLLMTVATAMFSQQTETTNPGNFLILIESIPDGVKLTGEAGCVFVELTFMLSNGQTQLVDQNGMTSIKDHHSPQDAQYANFLFSVMKTKDGFSFEGIEGTAWKNLGFSCPADGCHQLIDGNGMTDGW